MFAESYVKCAADCSDYIKDIISPERLKNVSTRATKKGIEIAVEVVAEDLDTEVRLRRREPPKIDAIEAGFEPESSVPRCHSVHSLSYASSQFQVADFPYETREREVVGREYGTPTNVVPPRTRSRLVSSQSDFNDSSREQRRTSLQALNAEQLNYSPGVPTSQFTPNADLLSPSVYFTPMSRRRSTQNADRLGELRSIGLPLDTSTPITKVAVAPTPHHRQRVQSCRDGEERIRHNIPVERRGSYHIPLPNERLVDGPASSNVILSLERRVKELEAAVQSNGQTMPLTPNMQWKNGQTHPSSSFNTSGQQQFFCPSTPQSTQQLEAEIERLQTQLRQAFHKMDIKQREYDEKVRVFKADSDVAKEELKRVVNKLNILDEEYEKYREQAAQMDSSTDAYRELLYKTADLERKLAECREELADKEALERQCHKMRREIDYLELQNNSLNKDLDAKEAAVNRLEKELTTLRMDNALYHQSCSSGSTPLAEDTESVIDVRSGFFMPAKPYMKAHSTLGTNMSPQPVQKNNLRKSLSNFALDATKKDNITPAMSRALRAQQSNMAENRLMLKCFKDVVAQYSIGKMPDIRNLLGIRDNLSESETEPPECDSTAMTMADAEKMFIKQEEASKKMRKDMDEMSHMIQQVFTSKLNDNDACPIQ